MSDPVAQAAISEAVAIIMAALPGRTSIECLAILDEINAGLNAAWFDVEAQS